MHLGRCTSPAPPGTFSGPRCALTATAGSDLCWQHTPPVVAACGHPTSWSAWHAIRGAPDLCDDCTSDAIAAATGDRTRIEFTHHQEDT